MIDKARTSGKWIFVPYCKLLLGSEADGSLRELPENMRDMIESYSIATEESGATTLEFTVNDPDFYLLNSSMIVNEMPVYFEWGWANDWDNIQKFTGYISEVLPDFADKGYPTLTITCMDETHLMNREEKTRTFENIKRSDLAKQIFQEYGIPCVVEDSGETKDSIEEKITQTRKTDIAFLQDLATEVVGSQFICYVENGTGYFVSRDLTKQPVVDLYYRDGENNDISSFKCRISKESIKFYKGSYDVSVTSGEAVMNEAGVPSGKVKTESSSRSIGGYGEVIPEQPKTKKELEEEAKSKKSAEKSAQDLYDTLQFNVCSGTVTPIIALPQLPSRCCINILGVGNILSGKYYVTSTSTDISADGLTQNIEVKKSEFAGELRLTDDTRDGRPSPLLR